MVSDTQLDTLEAKGLIRLATLQPELEYLFRHALVQDAAYESLLKQERRELHHSVGEALEELYPDRRGELSSVLALHFEQAGDNGRAIPYLIEAASFASDRNAIVEAYDLFGRAEKLLPARSADESMELLRQRVEVAQGRAKAGYSFLNDDEQMAIFEPLIADVERLGDRRLEADVYINIAFIRQFRGDRPENSPLVKRSLEKVTEIAAELNDPFIAAIPNALIGLFQVFTGDMIEGIAKLREAAPMLETKHAFVLSSFSYVALSIGLSRLGRFDEAEEAAQRAMKLGESGDLIAKLDSMIAESTVHSLRGDLETAVPIATRCTTMSEETGATACVVASNFVLGDTYARQGNFKSAQIAFERSNEVAESVGENSFRPSLLAYMRANSASLGGLATDGDAFKEALTLAHDNGDRFSEATVIWKRADFEAKRGGAESAQALADFADAFSRFEGMEAKPFEARTLRDWGEALRRIGRRDEGDDKLRRAVALFDQMGIKREAAEVREELAAA
jgi:tetratricopeptide (TPR) repeat protein